MDIFISYKRRDKDKVFRLVDIIKQKTGVDCWIDLSGIESDKQFVEVIIKAINKAKVVLFMYSHHHLSITDYEQDWTVRELDFAADKKKRIVFVNLDRSPLSDWFLFNFGRKEQIFADDPAAIERLCSDICSWLGIDSQIKPTYVRQEMGPVSSPTNNREFIKTNHKAVDLGLPSGLKWAEYNIGASKPEDFGNYFAWGEIESKANYSWQNYKFRLEGNDANTIKFSKYCTRSVRGIIDKKETLEPCDDAATSKWGKKWRIPTSADWEELKSNCIWKWEETGFRITSKVNGNSIFLPAAEYSGGFLSANDKQTGYYWTSGVQSFYLVYAYCLVFNFDSINVTTGDRYTGFTIRPVTTE